MPWGLYHLIYLGFIVNIFRWGFNSKWSPYKWRFYRWHKLLTQALYTIKISATRYWIWRLVKLVVGLVILASAFHELYRLWFWTWPGISFLGKQYPIQVGGAEFFIDLLFYHTRLRCYVVVELLSCAQHNSSYVA